MCHRIRDTIKTVVDKLYKEVTSHFRLFFVFCKKNGQCQIQFHNLRSRNKTIKTTVIMMVVSNNKKIHIKKNLKNTDTSRNIRFIYYIGN